MGDELENIAHYHASCTCWPLSCCMRCSIKFGISSSSSIDMSGGFGALILVSEVGELPLDLPFVDTPFDPLGALSASFGVDSVGTVIPPFGSWSSDWPVSDAPPTPSRLPVPP